jgi:hypothetical protein
MVYSNMDSFNYSFFLSYVVEWPALAKLGVDIASNAFLSVAFLMVIRRHYKIFGNKLHKTLLSNGVFFS